MVVLNGARTVGKSTLLQSCAQAHGVQVLDLDELATRQAVAADPAFFVTAPEPVCIDEFQHVLPVLDAIKAELNRDLRPGRYLLTGSTRYATLPAASQSLTGRAHVMTLWPLSQGELRGRRETFLDRLITDPASLVTSTASTTTRRDYEQMILTGGFPIAVARPTPQARRRWYRDFVDMVIDRDVLEIRRVRQRDVLPEILRRLAAQSAQLLKPGRGCTDDRSRQEHGERFYSTAGVGLPGASARRLRPHAVLPRQPLPKVHLVDSGLAGHLLGITESRLNARAPSTLTEFGHVIETFTVNEVLKQAGWAEPPLTFSHFRTKDGQEIDLVCETDDGRIAGVEVKAASSVEDKDFRRLRLLRDTLGREFVGGVVLYLGPRSYTREDRLHVLPLDCLWS